MKIKKIITLGFSIFFTLIFSLLLVALPTDIAFAFQINDKTVVTSNQDIIISETKNGQQKRRLKHPFKPRLLGIPVVPQQCVCDGDGSGPRGPRSGIKAGQLCLLKPFCPW